MLTGVRVQRYFCKIHEAGFSALACFQERRAHYGVDVRGAALHLVFAESRSIRAAGQALRTEKGCAFLARSTLSAWCRRFRSLAPKHAAVLRAHLSDRLPWAHVAAAGDPSDFLRFARAAFGLQRRWPPERFWDWLQHRLAAAGRGLLSA